MTFLSKFNRNFIYLILGRSSINIGDSFYMIALSLAVVYVYNIEVSQMSLFSMSMIIPSLLALFFGVHLDRVEDKKRLLVFLQICHVVLTVSMVFVLLKKMPLYVMYLISFLFSTVNVLSNNLFVGVVPLSLDHDEDLINRSVDIQYISGNLLDIVSNLVASILLMTFSYYFVLDISVIFFVFAIFLFMQLKLPKTMLNTVEEKPERQSTLKLIFENIGYFKSQNRASFVILIESFLSGATDLMLRFMPLYMVLFNYDLKWIGLVLACQRAADFVGTLVAPLIKVNHYLFFSIDYIVSGLCLLGVFVIEDAFVKIFLYFMAFLMIGISGNIFEKMVYSEYEHHKLAGISSIITFLYALFGLLFMILPLFYENIYNLAVVFNVLTVALGVCVFIFRRDKEKISENVS